MAYLWLVQWSGIYLKVCGARRVDVCSGNIAFTLNRLFFRKEYHLLLVKKIRLFSNYLILLQKCVYPYIILTDLLKHICVVGLQGLHQHKKLHFFYTYLIRWDAKISMTQLIIMFQVHPIWFQVLDMKRSTMNLALNKWWSFWMARFKYKKPPAFQCACVSICNSPGLLCGNLPALLGCQLISCHWLLAW